MSARRGPKADDGQYRTMAPERERGTDGDGAGGLRRRQRGVHRSGGTVGSRPERGGDRRQGHFLRHELVGIRQAELRHLPRAGPRVHRGPGHGSRAAGTPRRSEHGPNGVSNTPSLAYASFTPPFSLTNGPTGGFFRDGRASSLATQAELPFVTPFEMANQDAAQVVSRLETLPPRCKRSSRCTEGNPRRFASRASGHGSRARGL